MKSLIIFILLLVSAGHVYSQQLSLGYVDSISRNHLNNWEKERGILYVINGYPYDSLENIKADSVLKKLRLNDVVNVDYFKCDSVNIFHCNVGAIIAVTTASRQNKIYKRKYRSEAKAALLDKTDSLSVMLYINNTLIPSSKAKADFEALKFRKIRYIDFRKYIQPKKSTPDNIVIKVWTFGY